MTDKRDVYAALRELADEINKAVAEQPRPQLRGRQFDGTYYIRASDVADLLDRHKVEPSTAAALRKK